MVIAVFSEDKNGIPTAKIFGSSKQKNTEGRQYLIAQALTGEKLRSELIHKYGVTHLISDEKLPKINTVIFFEKQ